MIGFQLGRFRSGVGRGDRERLRLTQLRLRDLFHVIACALAAEAEVIVSSDYDLLTLGHYRDIDILSVAQMLRRLSTT